MLTLYAVCANLSVIIAYFSNSDRPEKKLFGEWQPGVHALVIPENQDSF